jgi:hypothetical protein
MVLGKEAASSFDSQHWTHQGDADITQVKQHGCILWLFWHPTRPVHRQVLLAVEALMTDQYSTLCSLASPYTATHRVHAAIAACAAVLPAQLKLLWLLASGGGWDMTSIRCMSKGTRSQDNYKQSHNTQCMAATPAAHHTGPHHYVSMGMWEGTDAFMPRQQLKAAFPHTTNHNVSTGAAPACAQSTSYQYDITRDTSTHTQVNQHINTHTGKSPNTSTTARLPVQRSCGKLNMQPPMSTTLHTGPCRPAHN